MCSKLAAGRRLGRPASSHRSKRFRRNTAMKIWTLAVLPLLALAPSFAQSQAQLEANKKVVMRFFNENIFANPEKIDEVLHPDYIQHNPVFQRYNEENNVKGRDGLKQFLASRAQGRGGQGKKQGPPPGAAGATP